MRRRLITVTTAAVLLGGWLGATPATAEDGLAPAAQVRLVPRTVAVDGIRTSYALLGPAAGLPLLLLNGTGSPMSQWDPALLARLSQSRPVIVYDYPGLGGSSPLPSRLTFGRLARHAHGLLSALGVARADVLGWSMGGFVAQRLATESNAVRRLVLAATNPGGPEAVLGPEWVQAADSDSGGSARGYVRANYPVGARDRGWAFVHRVNRAISEGRFPPDTAPARTYDAIVAAEDPWLRSPMNLERLRLLDVPTLVVTGVNDLITPAGNSRVLASAIPAARLELVPGAGHSFLFQRPASTARLLGAFLDQP